MAKNEMAKEWSPEEPEKNSVLKRRKNLYETLQIIFDDSLWNLKYFQENIQKSYAMCIET